jgi:hypothetical protein
MKALSKIKDNATAILLKTFANSFISDFGSIERISVDSDIKSIYLSIKLKGERESITIEITEYKVVKSQNHNSIQLHNIRTSREWLNVALNKYYIDRRIKVPSQFIDIVKFLL